MKIHWLSLDEARLQLAHALFEHLADNGSLTERIRQGCGGEFNVSLIAHEKLLPNQDESSLLGLSESTLALSRCVYLCCDETPQIFAKTILGLTKKNEKLTQRLNALGENSLGSILFRDPLAIKMRMHLALVPYHHDFFREAKLNENVHDEWVWMRRSLYHYQGSALIVYEAYINFVMV